MPEGPEERLHQKFGVYVLRSVIASGGSGVVYRAEAPDGRIVAIKVLDSKIRDALDVKRFEREAAIRIEHPNIVGVIDAGTDPDGRPFIALELLEGEPLSQRLKRKGTLDAAEVVQIAVGVCRGLEAAHKTGIVHRDLKPDNLFCCSDGTVKILDFGIALLESAETRMTTTGMVLGTPWYLAPEQARGDRVLDARVDLWGLGAVMYEALTGKPPFERNTMLATMLAILREPLVPVRQSLPSAPKDIAAVIEQCLVKDREKRWASAGALLGALEALVTATPKHPASPIPAAPLVATDEERVVAVVLAEETRDPAALEDAIKRMGGTYLPLVGQRAVGLFGGASWEGDELERAAAAAMAAQGAAGRLSVAAGRLTSHDGELGGEVLQAAEHGCQVGTEGVTVDAHAARSLTQRFALQPVGDGFSRLIERHPTTPVPPRRTFESVALRAGDSMLPAAGQAAELVGREVELSQMQGAVRTFSESGRASAVLIVGPTGIGKGRLRREMERLLSEAEPPIRMLQARAEPQGTAGSYALITDALRRRARVGQLESGWSSLEADAPLEARRSAVTALVFEAIVEPSAAKETACFIGELLGVPMPDSAPLVAARTDSQLMADRLRTALRDYVAGLCSLGPVALSAADLQWADTASLDLLEDLMMRLKDSPFMLVATARALTAEIRPGFLATAAVLRIAPRGLNAKEVARLASNIALRDLPAETLQSIVDRTDGNPLFVEQLVRELVERGKLDAPPESLPLPVSIEATIQSRLDHLPLLEKNLCKRAAVLSRPFTARDLEALGVQDALGLCESLRRRGVLTALGSGKIDRDRSFRFRAKVFGEVAYKMIADEVRAELHRRVAAVLESRAERDDQEIGFHYERGRLPDKAAGRYGAAALAAARRGDSETVLSCAARSLALGASPEAQLLLHHARAHAFHFLGRFDEQIGALDAALTHAADVEQRAAILIERVDALWWSGLYPDAIKEAERAVTVARSTKSSDLHAMSLSRQSKVLISSSRLSEAAAALYTARSLEGTLSPSTRAAIAATEGMLASARGDLDRVRQAYEEAISLHTESGDLRRAANHEMQLASLFNRVGAFDEAERALTAAIERCRRVGHRVGEANAWLHLTYCRSMQNRSELAREALEKARELSLGVHSAELAVTLRLMETRVRILEGSIAGLGEEAERIAADAELVPLPVLCARAMTLAARAHLLARSAQRALECAAAARVLRDQLGGLSEDEADVYAVHGECLAACDRHLEAEQVRAEGRARVEELAASMREGPWRTRLLSDHPVHKDLVGS